MGFIKDIISKIRCHHEWCVHKEVRTFDSSVSILPYKITQTLICKKCGKIKKISL